ncbi:hypothetical protein GCM10019060_34470 [Novosphingobium pokkalii]|nr:hypothetical protein GCM10019060_34470 [Novosphingobium pokkalii]
MAGTPSPAGQRGDRLRPRADPAGGASHRLNLQILAPVSPSPARGRRQAPAAPTGPVRPVGAVSLRGVRPPIHNKKIPRQYVLAGDSGAYLVERCLQKLTVAESTTREDEIEAPSWVWNLVKLGRR